MKYINKDLRKMIIKEGIINHQFTKNINGKTYKTETLDALMLIVKSSSATKLKLYGLLKTSKNKQSFLDGIAENIVIER